MSFSTPKPLREMKIKRCTRIERVVKDGFIERNASKCSSGGFRINKKSLIKMMYKNLVEDPLNTLKTPFWGLVENKNLR